MNGSNTNDLSVVGHFEVWSSAFRRSAGLVNAELPTERPTADLAARCALRLCGLSLCAGLLATAPASSGATLNLTDDATLALPPVGSCQLRVLSPTVLELTRVDRKAPAPAPVEHWDFVSTNQEVRLPDPRQFVVAAGARTIAVRAVGFKRRALYAPLKQRDLRVGSYLYLQLAGPVAENEMVEVTNPDAKLWPANLRFAAQAAVQRQSPVIHVNQTGYLPGFPKQAMVGFYLGSLGELDVPIDAGFQLLEVDSGKSVYHGRLAPRPESGFTFPTYEKVLEADFTEFNQPGEYRLVVPGLGASYSFFINDGLAAAFARTYALGLYHQRCGTSNELPYTRFVHARCHTAPAKVPTRAFAATQKFLAEDTADYTNNARHTAPQLKDVESGLYPFVNQGRVDVSGGHHDAGDYSKYTLNSAALIHHLVFAVDTFPGVGELDNLGLPESGDGKSDLLQEAKWEADFLAKMQDAGGGFCFLVYPRERRYENNVLPEQGDPQVVWPKNTAATAAAVAALAQMASSPLCKRQFPEAAKAYLEKAKKGWGFLERAIERHGRDGAYQKLTHYGNEFMHDDELAWAACEMFLTTGDRAIHQRLLSSFNPADPQTRKWGWWRLYEGYGCAIRSYAFAVQAGKLKREALNALFLSQCESEIGRSGEEQFRRARDSAYGTSFPSESKRFRSAGWYFSLDQAFDLAVASRLDPAGPRDPQSKFPEALLSNLNYEGGCNPVNVCYVTGLGWKRQREIVHHYAQNDHRALPPTGLPLGNMQSGFAWLDHYQRELGAMSFPLDGARDAPYPFYDRWGDSFNVTTEFVVTDLARSLATAAFLMAQSPLKNQPWKSAPGRIEIECRKSANRHPIYHARLVAPLDLRNARIVWEARNQEPVFGRTFDFSPLDAGPQWVEAEAQWPDGRRVFAVSHFNFAPTP